MTVPPVRRVQTVRCPICLEPFAWPHEDTVWRRDDNLNYERRDLSKMDPLNKAIARQDAYVPCPNRPEPPGEPHYLPATYNSFGQPLVVGLIGTPRAGKTHLLTAMIREAVDNRGLAAYGLSVDPMDDLRHLEFRRSHIEPLERGRQLDGTTQGVTTYSNILLVKGRRGARPVAFFDIAGEDLQTMGQGGWGPRFLAGANALMFVHGLTDDSAAGGYGDPRSAANRAFSMVLGRLRGVQPDLAELPAVIVATKADRMRYLSPVDRWWQDRPAGGALAERMYRESRDVYALLHRQGAKAALEPYDVFRRCTLHVVSASGCDADPDTKTFTRAFAPHRVLEPFLALLAMVGLVDTPDTTGVGR